ncbi:hypothetical protein HON22_02665 [Candidatus Peregrinibacteria bacterium]|jgi:hypothetical protein|nr:hypothetical protein [Candidatus Peregrinibacteria bacterium]MBT6756668.1 hypothetical protein [Candidatus Paceibacterota bacterium]
MDELNSLKSIIHNHQALHGKRKAFPKHVWDKIFTLAQKTPPAQIAHELEINPANMGRQMKKRQKSQFDKSSEISLLEVPRQAFNKKQMTIELPHNIVIRIDI